MYWKQFIAKLQHIKNINLEINKQFSNLNVLKKQIEILNTEKRQLEKGYTDVVSNLENVLSIIYQSLYAARQFNKDIDQKKVMPVPIVFPVLVDFDSSSNNKADEKKGKNNTDK